LCLRRPSKSLQSKWMHLQCVVGDIGKSFAPIEEAITEIFLHSLFATPFAIHLDLRTLTSLPVKSRESDFRIPSPPPPMIIPHPRNVPSPSPMLSSRVRGDTSVATRMLCTQLALMSDYVIPPATKIPSTSSPQAWTPSNSANPSAKKNEGGLTIHYSRHC